MLVPCPHCQNSVEAPAEARPREILCPACGSSFRVENQSTTAWPPEGRRKLGKFELLDVVGQGGFGTVYKAHDPELDRLVAIKIPRAGELAGRQELDRFLREARSVAQLRHPSIVPVYEVGQVEGVPFLVSEFVPGITLADLLTSRRPSPRESARLVATVADALQFAHEHGVVHRDVKPSNIMLEARGAQDPADCSPRIMDFGLAKRDLEELAITVEGQVLGTPAYMSPEQARGEARRVDGRSDVYSLGVILYRLLTGELPFRGNPRMLLHQVLHDEPRPPRRLNDKLPRDLQTVCLKAMAKDPRGRYQTAAELAADLRRFLAGRPVRARRVGRGERLWRWARRNPFRAVVVVLAVVTTLALAASAVSYGFAVHQSRAAEQLRHEQQQTRAALEEVATYRRQAERLSATLAFTQGLTLCEQGETARGVLWLTRGLQLTPGHAPDLERIIRLNLDGWRRRLAPLRMVYAHGREVVAVAFRADGKVAATGSQDRSARLWEVDTGKPLGEPLKHAHWVMAVAFSPDGKTLVTGSWSGEVRLWDVATSREQAVRIPHPNSPVRGVAFHPDGRTVLTAGGDGVGRLWDVATGEPRGPAFQHAAAVNRASFSPDGKVVVTASTDETAQLWEADTGRKIAPPLPHRARVVAAAFSPDGKTVVTGSRDGLAQLWEVDTGRPVGVRLFHAGTVYAAAFHPDGQVVATASEDGTARLWHAATGKPLGMPLRHRDEVRGVDFRPDGRALLTANEDGAARLWDVAALWSPGVPSFPAGQSLGPDALRAAAEARQEASQFGEGGPGTYFSMPWQHNLSNAVAFGPGAGIALTLSNGRGAVQLREVGSDKPVGPPLTHAGAVTCAAFRPDGRALLTGSREDNTLRLWDTATGALLGRPLRHTHPVRYVAFSRDGRTVAMSDDERPAAVLWDVSTGKVLGPPLPHESVVDALAFSQDGKSLVTGTADGWVRLWEVGSGKPLGPAWRHDGTISAAAFSPDGRLVLAGGWRGTAQLWEASTGRPVGGVLRYSEGLWAVAFSPDSRIALTGYVDGTVRLWDADTGRPRGAPLQHQGLVHAVAFSPDGRTILTAGVDRTARPWDLETGTPLGPAWHHPRPVYYAACSPDGRRVITGDEGRTLYLWEPLAPLAGRAEHLTLWAQVLTGMELDPDGGMHVLDAASWHQRRQQRAELGSSP